MNLLLLEVETNKKVMAGKEFSDFAEFLEKKFETKPENEYYDPGYYVLVQPELE